MVDGKAVEAINAGQEAVVVLDQTPFYAESGGQVGDKGELKGAGFTFAVDDTQKYGQAIGHLGKLSAGALKVGDAVQADVDEARRARIRLNHSATHLMHAALRQVLGTHVAQKGSLVSDKVLRFDFSHNEAMKPSEIREVEDLVNAQIRRNLPIETNIHGSRRGEGERGHGAVWREIRRTCTRSEHGRIFLPNCAAVLTPVVPVISVYSVLSLSPAPQRAFVVLRR
ncbi:alanyl-tRNA synthetase [Salmonella enterica subsp. enterica]|uniref:Alanine--tRNA ligase n=1 Tax=Salmonella enterica I TaxID=59201 RepID=A0A447N545_SALET|nr:alanyl-tRNA synthetase [Salmonella enterica subsp. enterica]